MDHATRGADDGFGHCKACYGDPTANPEAAKTPQEREESVRKAQGWAGQAFFEARIAALRPLLNPSNLARFNAMPYEEQCDVIARLIENGAII